jgi:hypothetical protein
MPPRRLTEIFTLHSTPERELPHNLSNSGPCPHNAGCNEGLCGHAPACAHRPCQAATAMAVTHFMLVQPQAASRLAEGRRYHATTGSPVFGISRHCIRATPPRAQELA